MAIAPRGCKPLAANRSTFSRDKTSPDAVLADPPVPHRVSADGKPPLPLCPRSRLLRGSVFTAGGHLRYRLAGIRADMPACPAEQQQRFGELECPGVGVVHRNGHAAGGDSHSTCGIPLISRALSWWQIDLSRRYGFRSV
jgi:hypothetical protein